MRVITPQGAAAERGKSLKEQHEGVILALETEPRKRGPAPRHCVPEVSVGERLCLVRDRGSARGGLRPRLEDFMPDRHHVVSLAAPVSRPFAPMG